MARVKLSNELKTALSGLTPKEKDKLIFRLLPKDSKLVDKLIFQLLEQGLTLDERRQNLHDSILRVLARFPRAYYSPGYLTLELRDISGRITYHKDITGDKLGEIELNYLMLTEIIEKNLEHLKEEGVYSSQKFNEYVVRRIKKLLTLTSNLHEDYILEFEDSMVQLGEMLSQIPSMKSTIKELSLDISQLKNGELP